MKIGIVQTKPVKGDIVANLADHQRWIGKAVEQGVDLLVFPELSITGYEPTLARELATTKEDERFDAFQWMSDKYGIVIGMGMPIRAGEADGAGGEAGSGAAARQEAGDGLAAERQKGGVLIGMVIFQPDEPRRLYAKQYLHADELPFFVPGNEQVFLLMDDNRIALSLCYELSVPEHSVNAYSNRANIYLSSSAKTAEGMAKALNTLTGIACTYSMTVLISNCVGSCDGAECGGQSAVMNDKGELLAKLGGSYEGMLIYDTGTGKVTQVSGTTRDRLTT